MEEMMLLYIEDYILFDGFDLIKVESIVYTEL